MILYSKKLQGLSSISIRVSYEKIVNSELKVKRCK